MPYTDALAGNEPWWCVKRLLRAGKGLRTQLNAEGWSCDWLPCYRHGAYRFWRSGLLVTRLTLIQLLLACVQQSALPLILRGCIALAL